MGHARLAHPVTVVTQQATSSHHICSFIMAHVNYLSLLQSEVSCNLLGEISQIGSGVAATEQASFQDATDEFPTEIHKMHSVRHIRLRGRRGPAIRSHRYTSWSFALQKGFHLAWAQLVSLVDQVSDVSPWWHGVSWLQELHQLDDIGALMITPVCREPEDMDLAKLTVDDLRKLGVDMKLSVAAAERDRTLWTW